MELKIEIDNEMFKKVADEILRSFQKEEVVSMKESQPAYLKKKDAARYIGCSLNTLDKYIKNGLTVFRSGNSVRISKQDIDDFMNEHKE